MKAAQINEYGDTSVIKINEVDKPKISSEQVLVEVYASSLNPFDSAVRSGYMKEMIPLNLPVTVGGDIAGVVAEIGEDVVGIKVGDKVYGQANVVAGNSGALAEFAATLFSQVAQIPSSIDLNQAASLPLVGISALQAIINHIDLQSNQKIFIHGGAGAIGSIAIQIAKNIGAYVATTATGEGLKIAKDLGADKVIDYKDQNFIDLLKDYDAVFDTVGGDDFNNSLQILKKEGIAVTMIANPDGAKAAELGVKVVKQMTQVTTESLNKLSELVEAGVVTVRIGKTFNLDQIQEAFRARESGEINGKIVVSIK